MNPIQAQLPRIFAVQDLLDLLASVHLDKEDFIVRYPHSALFCDRKHALNEMRDQVFLSSELSRKDFMDKYKVTPAFLKTKGIEIGFSTETVDFIIKEDFKVETRDDQKISRLLFDVFVNKDYQDEA